MWLRRTDSKHEPTLSPRKMERNYGLVFTNPDGTANGNAEWILNPDLSAVTGQPTKYWIITGDVVTLMNQAARDGVDAATQSARLDSVANELDQTQTIMRAFAEVVLDEINILRDQHSLTPRTLAQLKTAVRGKL